MGYYPAGMRFDDEEADMAMLQAECLKFARRLGRMYALSQKKYFSWQLPTRASWSKALDSLEKQCETLGFLTYDPDTENLDGYIISPDCNEAYLAGYHSVYQSEDRREV